MLFVCFNLLLITDTMHAQPKKARVLFIGNSYTATNNLPQIVADMATSTGDTLEYDVSAPGGARFYDHYNTVPTTTAKIQAGGWDYVVLQEQSQIPATTPTYFYDWVYPYAKRLADMVKQYNPCAETIFYMTWGRKNGDRSLCPWPFNWTYFCTYLRMDSVLRVRYMLMADSNTATVSPVGPVWRYIRSHYPGIELYAPDESHPSPAGSYAGACCFYTAFFKKPADSLRYDFSLPATDAANIRKAASKVVHDSLHYWHIGQYETIAGFDHTTNGMQPVVFTNRSVNALQYDWHFGNGRGSTAPSPTHTYSVPGTYTVRLIASGASCPDTTYARIKVTDPTGAPQFAIGPNPARDVLYIRSDQFTAGNYRLQIVNSMGQLVLEQRASGAEVQTIHLPGLASGVYTLNICTTRRIYRKKILVQ